jgi:hypothetical protein
MSISENDDGYSESKMSSTEYEKFTQTLYQLVLKDQKFDNIEVKHNTSVVGKSGAKHQIDVYWEHKVAGKKYVTFIECKHYKDAVSIGHIRNFHAVLMDTGATGIFVTTVGYQSGAQKYAKFYQIDTKLVKPTDEDDLKGRIRTIVTRIHLRTIANNPPPTVGLEIGDKDSAGNAITQEFVTALNALDPRDMQSTMGAQAHFRDLSGRPETETIGEMLPRLLPVFDLEVGVQHQKKIILTDKYLLIQDRLIPAKHLNVKYHIAETIETVSTGDALDIYTHILKDYESGQIEFLHGPTSSKSGND